MSNLLSLDNVTIKIANANVDNLTHSINFNLQSKNFPSLRTNVLGSAKLSECATLSQEEIVSLIWNRASSQCAQWIQYVNRSDLDIPALSGTIYTPDSNFVTIPTDMFYMGMGMGMGNIPPMA